MTWKRCSRERTYSLVKDYISREVTSMTLFIHRTYPDELALENSSYFFEEWYRKNPRLADMFAVDDDVRLEWFLLWDSSWQSHFDGSGSYILF